MAESKKVTTYGCAKCNAASGEACRRPNGKKLRVPHLVRIRAAARDAQRW